jgi:hypothetical protein
VCQQYVRRLVCDSATILNLSASSFFFLIHFFNDSLVVFGISVLSVHSRHLQSSLRHNREEGTELDRKGREGKGREGKVWEENFLLLLLLRQFCLQEFWFLRISSGRRKRRRRTRGEEVQDFLIHHLWSSCRIWVDPLLFLMIFGAVCLSVCLSVCASRIC